MDNKSTNPEFNALVKTVAAQAQVEVSLDEAPLKAIRRTFNDGADILALAKHHSNYSETHGRIYPLYDDDEGYGETEGGADTDEAVEDVYYHWVCLERATSFLNLAHHYDGLLNAISSLATWHPNYNDRNGLVD